MNLNQQKQTELKLYHFMACPYCARVRRTIDELGLDIEHRDVREEPDFYQELVTLGGKAQVPSLRIQREGEEARWLYESDDIIHFLHGEFGDSKLKNVA